MKALAEFGETHPYRTCNPQVFLEEPKLFFNDGFPGELDEE
jgi:hypothetical protein